MRKSILLLLPVLLSTVVAKAQFTLPLDTFKTDSLIISEGMFGANNPTSWGYLELTNMSSHTIDLSHYFVQNSEKAISKLNAQNKVSPKGLLPPGKSWTILQIAENVQTDPFGVVTNPKGYVNPMIIPMVNQLSYRKYQQVDSTGARITSFGVA